MVIQNKMNRKVFFRAIIGKSLGLRVVKHKSLRIDPMIYQINRVAGYHR